MKPEFKSIAITAMTFALVLSSLSCKQNSNSPKTTQPPPPKIDTSVTDEIIKTAESNRDILSAGGQPGTVSIFGPLSDEINYQDSHISVLQTPGESWRGKAAKLEEHSLVKSIDLTESMLKEIKETQELKTIIYVGCEDLMDTTSVLRPGNLEPVTFEAQLSDSMTMIKANTVFICAKANFPNRLTMIVAEKVYLNGLHLELSGGPENGISITTSELLLASVNIITTQSPKSETTLLSGPHVSIAALRIGDTQGGQSTTVNQADRLQINTYGSDYKSK